jgi:hypothetical protein
MPRFASQILRFLIKLLLGVVAAVFAVSLLAAGLIALALSLLKWLVTGKKPAFAIAFNRFRQFSPPNNWSGTFKQKRPEVNDVVDVEVREVHETRSDKHLP